MKLAPKPFKLSKLIFFVVVCGLTFLLISYAGVHKPSPSSAVQIFAAGADSIAVVSDVTQNPEPDARVRAWLQTYAKAA